MRVLLFGGNGQVGQEITARLTNRFNCDVDLLVPSQEEISITDAEKVYAFINESKPKIIINCAAYTAVDRAEEESEEAFLVNGEGVQNIARSAKGRGIRVLHLSTDYVFGEDHETPIEEREAPLPLNVYGESKLFGEVIIQRELGKDSLIIRTASVFGKYGKNFVNTILRVFKERLIKDEGPVRVVADQIMSPTWAGWLAEVVIDLLEKPQSGVIHATSKSAVSWYEFALAIREEGIRSKVLPSESANVQVKPVTQSEYASSSKSKMALRPSYSVLSTKLLQEVLPREVPEYRSFLRSYFRDLQQV
jgi:dTDP-4-dehydrorhamnose reductase